MNLTGTKMHEVYYGLMLYSSRKKVLLFEPSGGALQGQILYLTQPSEEALPT